MKVRALVDLSIRNNKNVFMNVAAGQEFTPPKLMDISSAIKQGYVEPVEEVKNDD